MIGKNLDSVSNPLVHGYNEGDARQRNDQRAIHAWSESNICI